MNHRDHELAFPDDRPAAGDNAHAWFAERGHVPREMFPNRPMLMRR